MQRQKPATSGLGGDVLSLLIALVACLAVLKPGLSAAETPRRVVSANLCADQLLMVLADPEQIVSLSPFATDPQMSFLADRAKAFRSNRGAGEALVMSDADLVLVGPYDSRYTRNLLAGRQIEFLSLPPWDNIDGGVVQIRSLAARLGHAGRGERLIEEINASLEKLRNLAATGAARPSSLVLHRRGYVFHAGVTGELFQLAGLRDAAPDLGVKGAGFVRLERLLTGRPDFLIVAGNPYAPEDQGEAMLVHPALTKAFPLERRLVIPDVLTLCGGPSTPALAERIGMEIRQKILARQTAP